MKENIAVKNVLITGATGNVGMALIEALEKINHLLHIIAAVKNTEDAKVKLGRYNVSTVEFDFENLTTCKAAMTNCSILFLLRPPQISNIKKYFTPILEIAKECNIQHIIFLSVQGVEKNKRIPHYKIEKLIVDSKIGYTFLRPAYFMQNFITTLNDDLKNNKKIILPAGNAKFTLVDVRDIGAVAAQIILNTSNHINKVYELTSTNLLSFSEMAKKLSIGLGKTITYVSPNLVSFFIQKRKQKMPVSLILVMIMLHYLPRFQQLPKITNCIKSITGNQPISFDQFIIDNQLVLK
jgi:uncharacterized protein YbjT (DUF2867 family)